MRKVALLSMALLMWVSMSAQEMQAFVAWQLETYPESRLLDIYKSCFQDYMGAEHLVADSQRAKAYLDEELAAVTLDELMPWYYEPCGTDSCYYRVSLRVVKEGKVPEDVLLDAFVRSANSERTSVEAWSARWHTMVGVIDEMRLELPNYQEDKHFIDSVLAAGKYAISHSPEYRQAYRPHYRIVERTIFENEILPLISNAENTTSGR